MRWAGTMLAAAVVMSIAPPVLADWGATRWGMSQSDVMVGLDGRATVQPDGNLFLTAPPSIAGFQFDDVTYGFVGGRLARLTYTGRSVSFPSLRQALTEQFGEPIRQDSSVSRNVLLFLDNTKNNSILIVDRYDNSVTMIVGKIENRF